MNFGLWMLDSGFLLFLVPFLFTVFYSKTCSCELWIMQNTHPNFALDTHATFLFCIVNIWHVCEIRDTQNGGLLGFAIGRVVCGILKSRDHCAGGVHTTGLIKLCYNQVVEIPNAVPNGLWVSQVRIYSWTCMCGMHFVKKKVSCFERLSTLNPRSLNRGYNWWLVTWAIMWVALVLDKCILAMVMLNQKKYLVQVSQAFEL